MAKAVHGVRRCPIPNPKTATAMGRRKEAALDTADNTSSYVSGLGRRGDLDLGTPTSKLVTDIACTDLNNQCTRPTRWPVHASQIRPKSMCAHTHAWVEED
jgi:hypothetical protein